MRCTSPRTVGFKTDGKTISWSPKHHSKEYPLFQLPCGKCIACRLSYARDCAVRCMHEAQMHQKNCFITLTYDDANLVSPKLIYSDFQKFMKKLRKIQNAPIGVFVTGEYGTINKRPHWHAILFNWSPSDPVPDRENHRGDKTFTSETLTKIWGKGMCNYGSVTLESAGYVARYAAKKLVHGQDEQHDFHPISKRSSKHAIGKKWLEQFWPDIFNYGKLRINETTMPIPRYYEKWFKKHHPERWNDYVTQTKFKITCEASKKAEYTALNERQINDLRASRGPWSPVVTRNQARSKILEQKFNEHLQKNLKL